MSELATTFTTGDAVTRRQVLVIGMLGIGAKEELVLRSLVRLLHGVAGLELRMGDSIDECNVVFIATDARLRVPPPVLSVHVVADPTRALPPGLWVQLPLRAGNVGGVLEAAAGLLRRQRQAAGEAAGLTDLFHALAAHLMARERRAMAFPFAGGPTLWVEFGAERCRCELPSAQLLLGSMRLAAPRRMQDDEMAAAAQAPGWPLRPMLWQLAHRLEDLGVAAPVAAGRYRLVCWPDTEALRRPNVPRLSALLTSRALDASEACRASGASANAVGWFLATTLALGIAEPAVSAEQEAVPAPPRTLPPPPPAGLLDRLKERLKLW